MLNKNFILLLLILSIVLLCNRVEGRVVDLNENNFDRLVLNSKGPWIVAFVASWCGHCQRLHPEYDKAAESLGGLVNLGRIDADQEKELGTRYGVRGFPTIKVFNSPNKENPDDYQSGRDAYSIANFAMSLFDDLIDPVEEIKDTKGLETFLNGRRNRVKVILFTKKSKNPGLFKSLGIEFSGKISFGFISTAATLNEEFSKSLKKKGLGNAVGTTKPIIKLVISKNDPMDEEEQDEVKEYSGPLKKYDLVRYFEKFQTTIFKKIEKIELALLTQENLEKCKGLCIIGCVAEGSHKNLKNLVKEYKKEGKLEFLVADQSTTSSFCQKFKSLESIEKQEFLVVYRYKKLKYAVHQWVDSLSVGNSARFFEKILYGGMKYNRLENQINVVGTTTQQQEQKDEL